MSVKKIAGLIPAEYRKEILELDMIERAQPVVTSETMHYLAVIWKNYVEKDFTGDCNLCYARVLDNFKALKPIFIEMEKEAQLLQKA